MAYWLGRRIQDRNEDFEREFKHKKRKFTKISGEKERLERLKETVLKFKVVSDVNKEVQSLRGKQMAPECFHQLEIQSRMNLVGSRCPLYTRSGSNQHQTLQWKVTTRNEPRWQSLPFVDEKWQ